jgi:flagellar basal-body rod protein FlgF
MATDIKDITAACERLVARLDSVTNNVANVSTAGFKEEYLHFIAQSEGSMSKTAPPVFTENASVNMSQGLIQQTGQALDVAIDGEGFFVVQAQEGPLYTRKGNFGLGKTGELVTSSGDPVLGENGPLAVRGKDVHIDNQGLVTVDGNQAGRLRIVTFDQPQKLARVGHTQFKDPGTAGLREKKDPQLVSGSLEGSNVNVVRQMVAMIELQRHMESYQKLIQAVSDEDRISTTRVGKL